MGKLANIAKNISGFGGVAIKINDLIAEYPDGVTVNGAFLMHINKTNSDVPGFIFAEAPDKFFYAEAGDLKKLFDAWLSACNNNIEELNEQLGYEQVILKIFKKNIGGGKTYTKAVTTGTVEKPRNTETATDNEKVDEDTGEVLPPF